MDQQEKAKEDLKKKIRIQVLKNRLTLSEKEQIEKSDSIVKKILNYPAYLNCKSVYIYYYFRGEVRLNNLAEEAWKSGKKVAFPKVENKDIKFYYVNALADLTPGVWGILEPTPKNLAVDEESLIVMPGIAFTAKKQRLGYGGGYYDCYLKHYPKHPTIACAFELQMISDIPELAHDIRPDAIVTERKIYE